MLSGAPILTQAQMRAAEQAAFDGGVDPYALMERAGARAAEIIWRAGAQRDTLVLCGPGNNGGDGFVVARRLAERGVPVRVAASGESMTDSSRRARAAWGGPVEDIATAGPASQLVDALFGIGLTRGLDAALAGRLLSLAAASAHSFAIDVPSGVDTDSGMLLSDVPRFGVCIALGALKPAHVLRPSAGRFRRLICADIGIDTPASVQLLPAPHLPAPPADAYKYSRGLVAIVGGSMAGAGILAATAAARGGAGAVRHIAAGHPAGVPDAVILIRSNGVDDLKAALRDKRIAAVLIGPGLGLSETGRTLLNACLEASPALVLDADAITLLAEKGPAAVPDGAILTPHEGEFLRLFGALPGNKIARTIEAARLSGAVVVYKGPDTVIAAPDGRAAVSGASSPWLSTAGTGDVLAGLCAARLAVTGDPFRAACEAVWLHADAARRAGSAFIADDLPDQLSAAIASRS